MGTKFAVLMAAMSFLLTANVVSAAISCESCPFGYQHCDAFFSNDVGWDWQRMYGPYSFDSPNGLSYIRAKCFGIGRSRLKNLVEFDDGSGQAFYTFFSCGIGTA